MTVLLVDAVALQAPNTKSETATPYVVGRIQGRELERINGGRGLNGWILFVSRQTKDKLQGQPCGLTNRRSDNLGRVLYY
jgi:hypothetical protein